VVFGLIDKGLLEFFGPTGLGVMSFRSGAFLTSLQTGRAYDYAWLMVGALYFYNIVANILSH
jgi:hypothetical protein